MDFHVKRLLEDKMFKPIHGRIMVKRLEAKEMTEGGLHIPDANREKPNEGEVILACEFRFSDAGEKIPLQVKEGDKVLFSKYAGTEIEVEGETVVILDERDVLAVSN
jgi:chaperonin GroES